jgi:hypothetical protein
MRTEPEKPNHLPEVPAALETECPTHKLGSVIQVRETLLAFHK